MQELAKKYQTTLGICGFVTCACTKFVAKNGFNPSDYKNINEKTLTPYIEDAMKNILARRRQ